MRVNIRIKGIPSIIKKELGFNQRLKYLLIIEMITLDKDKLTIKDLKKLCKHKHIKNYSKLKKNELIELINKNISSIKIQRYLRSRWIDGLCPISMETVKYPCFAFRPKGFLIDKNRSRLGTSFIYYNLESLIDYLLTVGDFRDPKTREPYNDDTLASIDSYKERVGMKRKSVYKASQNRNIYKKKKDQEEDLIVLERCLDEVVSSIRIILETPRNLDQSITLNSFHFPTFHRYFRNILYKSKDYGKHVLDNTIHIISGPDERPTPDPNNIKDFILQFMFTLESTYF